MQGLPLLKGKKAPLSSRSDGAILPSLLRASSPSVMKTNDRPTMAQSILHKKPTVRARSSTSFHNPKDDGDHHEEADYRMPPRIHPSPRYDSSGSEVTSGLPFPVPPGHEVPSLSLGAVLMLVGFAIAKAIRKRFVQSQSDTLALSSETPLRFATLTISSEPSKEGSYQSTAEMIKSKTLDFFAGPPDRAVNMIELLDGDVESVLDSVEGVEEVFNLDLACLLAGFSFQSYVEPPEAFTLNATSQKQSAIEEGPNKDGDPLSQIKALTPTATISLHCGSVFEAAYTGAIGITLRSIQGLKPEEDFGQTILTGSARDLYMMLWLDGVQDGRGRPTFRMPCSTVRTATRWRLGAESSIASLDDETVYLPIPKGLSLNTLCLNILLLDENVGKDDELLGQTSLPLHNIIRGLSSPTSKTFNEELLFSVPSPFGPGAVGGAAIGGMVAGPMGAAVGAGAGMFLRSLQTEAKLKISAEFHTSRDFVAGMVRAGEDENCDGRVASSQGMTEGTPEVEPLPKRNQFLDTTRTMFADVKKTIADRGRVNNDGDGSGKVANDDSGDIANRSEPLVAVDSQLIAKATPKGPKASDSKGVPSSNLSKVSKASNSKGVPSSNVGVPVYLTPAEAAVHMHRHTISDWSQLSACGHEFELIASVDEHETDTQLMVWRSIKRREIVVSFRGTQENSWRDIMTDASLLQVPWFRSKGTEAPEEVQTVHTGFKTAYASTASYLQALVWHGIPNCQSGWKLFLTGHSLGGALATLAALDLVECGATASYSDVSLYTFGAPRVGNKPLCQALDAAVPKIFRVVNGQDIITRVPRAMGSSSMFNGALDYEHSGIPVVVDENFAICQVGGAPSDAVVPADGKTGTSEMEDSRKHGIDPRSGATLTTLMETLEELEQKNDPVLGVFITDLHRMISEIVEEETLWYDSMSNETSYMGQLLENFNTMVETGQKVSQLQKKLMSGGVWEALDATTIASLIGLQEDFIAVELAMVESINTGEAMSHHMEDSYFKALTNACSLKKGEPCDP